MSSETKTLEYVLPAYWASYLINGDDSGMSEQDKKDCAAFLASKNLKAFDCIDCGPECFSRTNDATALGGDTCLYTFVK